MTDSNLLSYLKKHEINFVLHEHEAMHTMDDVVELQSVLQGPIPKNLFLKSNKNNFYLVSMVGSKKLDIKSLKKKLEVSELSFASEEELKNYLNLKPGSVSIFGVINVEP